MLNGRTAKKAFFSGGVRKKKANFVPVKHKLTNMPTKIITIREDDTEIRIFENQYPVPRGMSYNSHILIGGGRNVILNSVDCRCAADWLDAILKAIPDGQSVDYFVIQHVEPDHGGGIELLLRIFPEAKVVASDKALRMLADFYPSLDLEERAIVVKNGDILSLGDSDDDVLKFIAAPMIHWPEVMMAYHPATATLFSADAFGSFGAVNSYGEEPWPDEARRYYCNIVGKYGAQVKTALAGIASLDIKCIKPIHGHDLNAPLDPYVDLYKKWSTYTPELPDGVLVAYSSVYGATAKAAGILAESLRRRGREVCLVNLNRTDASEALAQAFRMGSAVFASITYDGGVMPSMRDLLSRLVSKGWRGRRVGFIQTGSWAPVAAKVMHDVLAPCKDLVFSDCTVTIHSSVHDADIPAIESLAESL